MTPRRAVAGVMLGGGSGVEAATAHVPVATGARRRSWPRRRSRQVLPKRLFRAKSAAADDLRGTLMARVASSSVGGAPMRTGAKARDDDQPAMTANAAPRRHRWASAAAWPWHEARGHADRGLRLSRAAHLALAADDPEQLAPVPVLQQDCTSS
jgi:hypothetical protein